MQKSRTWFSLRRLLVLMASTALLAAPAAATRAQNISSAQPSRTLLAIFAHADDETMVGPLLAHYATQPRTRVVLAIVTNGDRGVMPFARVPAGEELANVRAKEAACACAALGVERPVLLGFPDGGLATSQVLAEAAAKLTTVLDDVRPDAIVTWGPDGGYGHPDHRLVSAVVTQLVQAGQATPHLYYVGLPKSRLESDAMKGLRFPAPFAPVIDEVLNVRVPYSDEDANRARKSLACHASQFTPETMEVIAALTRQINGGRSHLRRWSGGPAGTDLFVGKQ